MLRNQWQDANFGIGAISDRVPFREEEEIIVLAAPDPQGGAPGAVDSFTLRHPHILHYRSLGLTWGEKKRYET
jgi:hypothetical protein